MNVEVISKTALSLPKSVEGLECPQEHIVPETATLRFRGFKEGELNALRRTCIYEVPMRMLRIESFVSTENFLIPEHAYSRISSIPINQKIPAGTRFEIKYDNTSTQNAYMMSEVINAHARELGVPYVCNDGCELFALKPGCAIAMRLVVCEDVGLHNPQHNAANVCTFDEEKDAHLFMLETNGEIGAFECLSVAAAVLGQKLEKLASAVPSQVSQSEFVFTIPNETNTVTSLLLQNTPSEIKFFAVNTSRHSMNAEIRLSDTSTENAKKTYAGIVAKTRARIEEMNKLLSKIR